MIRAVLFDLDGTLVNSLEDIAFGVNRSLTKFGFPTHPTEDYRYFVGNGIPKMIERALPSETDEKIRADVTSDFLSYYALHDRDFSAAYDGVKELLEELKNRGMKLAVVTNKADAIAQTVIKGFYGDLFDVIFGNREGILPKPDPTAARLTMEMLSVTPEQCVFVGDSGVDVATGKNSGAYPVGVLWGFREREELQENGAAAILEKPHELLTVIDCLNKGGTNP